MTPDQIATKSDIHALEDKIEDLKRLLSKVTFTPPPKWITVQEYASRVGKSEATVRRWKRDGKVEIKGEMILNPDF